MTIKRKLIIAFLLLTIMPIFVFESIVSISMSTLKQDILNSIMLISEGKEAEILQYLGLLKERTIDFAHDGFIAAKLESISHLSSIEEKKVESEMLAKYLLNIRNRVGSNIINIDIFDNNLQYAATIGNMDEGCNGSQCLFAIKEHLEETYVDDIHYHRVDTNNKILVVDISTPIKSANGSKMLGTLVIHFSLNPLKNILHGMSAKTLGATSVANEFDGSVEMFLIDKNGFVIASLENSGTNDTPGERLMKTEPVIKCLKTREEVKGEWTDIYGKRVWGSSMCLKISDNNIWILLVQKSKGHAIKPIYKARMFFYMIGIVVLALVSAFSLYMFKTIYTPIKQLHEGVKRVGLGDLDYRVKSDAQDEMGELAREFDWMADNLVDVIEKYKTMVDKYRGLMDILPTGVKVTGAGTKLAVKELNNAILTMFGYNTKEEFLKVPVENIFIDMEDLDQFCAMCDKGPVYHYELRFKRKDGSAFWASVNSTFYTTDDGKKEFINVVEDITEKKKYEDKLKQMAYYDPLTGLPNRKLFLEHMAKTIQMAKRYECVFALLFIDLDKFKEVNDTLGHDVGDMLLKEASKRMNSCIRESDVLARLGGDEFVIILPHINDKKDAAYVAQKIIKTIAAPFDFNGLLCSIGTSIGISLYPQDGEDTETLVKKADSAMYNVKQEKRNNYKFYKE